MSEGKTLEDLIKEHKEEDDQPPQEEDRKESNEERERREARLKAMQKRLEKPKKIDDRSVKISESNPHKSSGGKNERVLEGRARALLNKKDKLEDDIYKKEKEEKNRELRKKQEEEEMKLYRTESQKQRANQIVNRYGDLKNKPQEEEEEDFEKPNPFIQFQGCISEILYQEFQDINKDTNINLIQDDDDMEVEQEKVDDEVVKFVFEEIEKVIKAHKFILTSKLPLFRSMLSGNMKESSTRQIDVYDTEFETYFAFIEFIYTGEIKKLDSNHLVELLELSDRFCAGDLRTLIEDKLTENLDPGTVKDILEVAHHYKLNTLKQECWRYAKREKQLMARYGVFKQLEKEDMEQIKIIDT